jgi:hypothetical protein
MKSKSTAVFIILFSLFFFNTAKAQVQVLEKDVLEKIQNGHTHVVVKDPNSKLAGEFLESFKKSWTVTKGVDMIAYDNLVGNLVEGDNYFSMETLTFTSSYGKAIYAFFNLWQPTKRMLKDKKIKVNHEDALARIQLSIDIDAIKELYFTDEINPESGAKGHVFHWNPGLLKNYLQMLCAELKTGKKTNYQDEKTNKTLIKELSGKTLYYPEDNLNKIGFFLKSGTVDTKDLFDEYKFKYKVISDDELGGKIMADSEEFYYFLFVRISGSKLLLVVNSHTGEIIYSRFSSAMFSAKNVNKGDLKDLYKTINKN